MILLNITFFMEPPIETDFRSELHRHLPAAESQLLKLLPSASEEEPDAVRYALHIYLSDIDALGQWQEVHLPSLLQSLQKKFGERLMAFATPMESIKW